MKRWLIAFSLISTSFLCLAQGKDERRSSKIKHCYDTPATILLYWSHRLDGAKFDQSLHELEHVYADDSYLNSDYTSRQAALEKCAIGTCGKSVDKAFQVQPRYVRRRVVDRLQSFFEDDYAWCDICTPNDSNQE